MQPSISVVTLAVADLAQAVHFYQAAFGWPSKGVVGDAENDTEVAFFTLNDGLQLALWPRQSLQRQLGVDCQGHGGLLSHNATSEQQVDAIVAQAKSHGATEHKAPHWQPWGCYGAYIADPDGHCWEITYNPKR